MRTLSGNAIRLTDRERECLQRISDGLTTPQIAVAMEIGERTVETHVGNAMRKLGALTRAHAIANAMRRGWLT